MCTKSPLRVLYVQFSTRFLIPICNFCASTAKPNAITTDRMVNNLFIFNNNFHSENQINSHINIWIETNLSIKSDKFRLIVCQPMRNRHTNCQYHQRPLCANVRSNCADLTDVANVLDFDTKTHFVRDVYMCSTPNPSVHCDIINNQTEGCSCIFAIEYVITKTE